MGDIASKQPVVKEYEFSRYDHDCDIKRKRFRYGRTTVLQTCASQTSMPSIGSCHDYFPFLMSFGFDSNLHCSVRHLLTNS